jgi:oxygen-independent coproporphyrinogen-3 oxidase
MVDAIGKLQIADFQMLGLYLHIPFCQALCSYCNFNRGLFDAGLMARYVRARRQEIEEAADGRAADTVFFGGGTPSLLEPATVRDLITSCRNAFTLTPDAEVTLEANPETVTPAKMAGFRNAGVNRISFGVQSFDDGELHRLERVHSARRAVEAIDAAREAGFDNLSVDLMLWLPGQSPASWRQTVRRATELDPEHLSMYLLELYPNAPLKEAMARVEREDARGWAQAAEDQAADMYLEGLELTDAAGYRQYEISSVAWPGRESRHNLKYWQSGAWRGFGCGAHSTADGLRWRNVSGTAEYIDRVGRGRSVRLDVSPLSPASRVEEALFTGLRLSEGVNRRNFQARFGVDPWQRYGATIGPYVAEGLMWQSEERFGLTRRGMLVANSILSVFV